MLWNKWIELTKEYIFWQKAAITLVANVLLAAESLLKSLIIKAQNYHEIIKVTNNNNLHLLCAFARGLKCCNFAAGKYSQSFCFSWNIKQPISCRSYQHLVWNIHIRPKKKSCLVVLHCPPLIFENWKKVFTVQKYTAPNFSEFQKKFFFFFDNFEVLKIFLSCLFSTCLHFNTDLKLV